VTPITCNKQGSTTTSVRIAKKDPGLEMDLNFFVVQRLLNNDDNEGAQSCPCGEEHRAPSCAESGQVSMSVYAAQRRDSGPKWECTGTRCRGEEMFLAVLEIEGCGCCGGVSTYPFGRGLGSAIWV
jgi:hypothetical protein